jgi:hypothetical protein
VSDNRISVKRRIEYIATIETLRRALESVRPFLTPEPEKTAWVLLSTDGAIIDFETPRRALEAVSNLIDESLRPDESSGEGYFVGHAQMIIDAALSAPGVQAVAKEIAELRRNLARKEQARDCLGNALERALDRAESAERRIAELEKAWDKYGSHTEQCDVWLGGSCLCSCGYNEAAEVLEGRNG